MKYLLAVIFALIAQLSWGSCTSSQVGDYTYTRCSDGTSITSSQIGDYTYHRGSDGSSITESQIGDYTYRRHSDGGLPRGTDRPSSRFCP